MKHPALTGLVTSTLGLLVVVGFACVDADIPNVSNDLRDQLAETYGNPSGPPAAAAGNGGAGGSASVPSAGAGGAPDDDDEPADLEDDDPSGGAAGSSMAGGDAVGSAGSGPVSGGCDGFAILATNCATAGCHGQPGAPLGDFASSEEAARAFIGEESGLSCAGQGAIIDTDDPAASLLVTKLSEDYTCGSRMPIGGELTEEEIACVEEWIGGL